MFGSRRRLLHLGLIWLIYELEDPAKTLSPECSPINFGLKRVGFLLNGVFVDSEMFGLGIY